MNFSPEQLGIQIQQARKARNLSQKQLADIAGIGKTAMFDLEHGNPGVRLNTLLAVLEKLDMALDLVTPENETAPKREAAAGPQQTVGGETSIPSPQESLPDHLL